MPSRVFVALIAETHMSEVSKVRFADHGSSIAKALDLIGAGDRLPSQGTVIIKPNLTNADPPPVTTSVAAAEAVYDYCRSHCKAEIVIGEGCGSGVTADTFMTRSVDRVPGQRGGRHGQLRYCIFT